MTAESRSVEPSLAEPPQPPTGEPDPQRDIVLSRRIEAPRELVFAVWTDPRHVSHWWGPRGFTTTTHEMDVRPGGTWRFVMHGPDGVDYPNRIEFVEVERPARLAYRHAGDAEGDALRFAVTVTFTERAGGTEVTLWMRFASPAVRDLVASRGAVEGGEQTLERLAEQVQREALADETFVVTRLLEAPRGLVFRAWTDTAHLARWWGPKGFAVEVRDNDPRPGGRFLYRLRAAKGAEMWGKWIYRELVPPERLVYVSSFADEHGRTLRAPFGEHFPLEVLSTVTFTEQPGGTLLRLEGVPFHATEEERRAFAAMQRSMQQGWGGTLDQLVAWLADLAAEGAGTVTRP